MKKASKLILILVAVLLGGLVLIQMIPYGRDHSNPPVVSEPKWDTSQTRELASRACFDCHSNETIWPWYSNIAPASWLIKHDVEEGRQRLNFSNWNANRFPEAGEFAEVIQEGEMPPLQYLLIYSNSRLSDAEKSQLISGLSATLSSGSY